MTWSPANTQERGAPFAATPVHKMWALARWVMLMVLAGLAFTALVGIAVTTLFTAIENGL